MADQGPRTRPGAGKPATGKGARRKPAPSKRGPGKAGGSATGTGRVTPKPSGRYTPPIPREQKVSPRWVPVLMLTLLIAGMLVIVLNYMNGLPGDTSNAYLLLGLVLITGGFITATRYR